VNHTILAIQKMMRTVEFCRLVATDLVGYVQPECETTQFLGQKLNKYAVYDQSCSLQESFPLSAVVELELK